MNKTIVPQTALIYFANKRNNYLILLYFNQIQRVFTYFASDSTYN